MIHRALRTLVTSLALMLVICGPVSRAQTFTPQETARSVRRVLERLPYYGVFDYIVYAVDRGTVRLAGFTYQPGLKEDAAGAVKHAHGVDEVLNKIEVLPASGIDDRIRWATFYRIYNDDFLSRYAPGGQWDVRRELRDERRFPGMEPVGVYPIHIIVKDGRVMLLGAVDNAGDRQLAEVRAREVSGVFEVQNELVVPVRGN